MCVNLKPVDDGYRSYIYNHMMLIHESHVIDLQIDMMFKVCEPCSFFSNATSVIKQ